MRCEGDEIMNAKEMFEESGYTFISFGSEDTMYNYRKEEITGNNEIIISELVFYTKRKEYWASSWYNEFDSKGNILRKEKNTC